MEAAGVVTINCLLAESIAHQGALPGPDRTGRFNISPIDPFAVLRQRIELIANKIRCAVDNLAGRGVQLRPGIGTP